MLKLQKVEDYHYVDLSGRFEIYCRRGEGWRWADIRTKLCGPWRQTRREAERDLAEHDAGREATDRTEVSR